MPLLVNEEAQTGTVFVVRSPFVSDPTVVLAGRSPAGDCEPEPAPATDATVSAATATAPQTRICRIQAP